MQRSSLLLFAFLIAACSSQGWNRPVEVAPPETMRTPSGVLYQDLVRGNGAPAVHGTRVTVHYVGSVKDGEVFDSSYERGTPVVFTVGKGEVIAGWEEGILGMRFGGKRRLEIPPELAYGSEGSGPIPPEATLVLDIELMRVSGP